jgi:hypothetical protein
MSDIERICPSADFVSPPVRRADVERLHDEGKIKGAAYGVAMADADDGVTAAAMLAAAEASHGWRSVPRARVLGKIDVTPEGIGNVEEARSLIAEFVRADIEPCGRGYKVPVEKRALVSFLTPTGHAVEIDPLAKPNPAKLLAEAQAWLDAVVTA